MVEEAVANGCGKAKACQALGLSARTLQHWQKQKRTVDGRTQRVSQPAHKLSEAERREILKVVNSPEYRDMSPCQIVPALADQKRYLASEATIYRLLREERMLRHREPTRPAKRYRPTSYSATGPRQVWTWDITYLPTRVKGQFLYLYLIMDIYSRKIVAWEIHTEEAAHHASLLAARAYRRENVNGGDLVLHSDNGSPMKGATMLATLQRLGVVPSFSRPSVSDDNPYSESLFRTLKYRPGYPRDKFESIDAARAWMVGFVNWYNFEHRHSALKFVTPHQRHEGMDGEILVNRTRVYEAARQRNTHRWSGKTRDWSPQGAVHLNPHKHEAPVQVAV